MSYKVPSVPAEKTDHGRDVFVRGVVGHRDIYALEDVGVDPSRTVKFSAKRKPWMRGLVLGAVLLLATSAIAVCGHAQYVAMRARIRAFNKLQFRRKSIRGGEGGADGIDDIVDGDGMIGNPDKYPASTCELPNYLSKDGNIVAVSSNGTEVPLHIKGVNWFGMETKQAIPFGLWDNATAGTTAYQVASFLSTNSFNAVRLPVMVRHVLNNTIPNRSMINTHTNHAVSVKDYRSLLQSIVKVLQYRRIGVLISLHTLTETDSGGLWYNDDVSEAAFLESFDILTSLLCSSEYWNVLGLDLKNEPHFATWGSGKPHDFRLGAARLAERMLKGCPRWLAFVEGLNYRTHDLDIDGERFVYSDWYGGGLQDAAAAPLEFRAEHKVVWAPHYYTSAVFVQPYFYGGGTPDTDARTLRGYVELSDAALRRRVGATMHDMFGFLTEKEPRYAVVLGEFGGLYARDEHPRRTIQRTVDATVAEMMTSGYAGGFAWSLNPESKYQYVAADKGSPAAAFDEGLLGPDWLTANSPFLKALEPLDALPHLRKFPCFPIAA
ncbi:hypothetical protein PybrP1_000020 [[Pythium] brassicae (nom. inval.)]|nr:hypothetical protein PybrP1_000020 [[Pythium] brassicae (nom. inval.)]